MRGGMIALDGGLICSDFMCTYSTVPHGSWVAFHVSCEKQLSPFPPLRVLVGAGHKKYGLI